MEVEFQEGVVLSRGEAGTWEGNVKKEGRHRNRVARRVDH